MDVNDQTILQLVAGQARIEQQLTDFDKRLLGGEGQKGILPVLYEKHESLANRVGVLENRSIRSKGWIAGATAVITAVGTVIGSVVTWLLSVSHHAQQVKH